MSERDQAIILLERKNKEWSFVRSLAKSWRRILLRVVAIVFFLYLYFNFRASALYMLAIGMLFGAMLQDIGWIFKIKQSWPFTNKIMNWSKVEEIANGQS
jgi:hypothetical protein